METVELNRFFAAFVLASVRPGVAYLCRALACAALDGETFLAELENFVNTVEAWRRLVSDYRDNGAAPAAADVPPGDGEFLRV